MFMSCHEYVYLSKKAPDLLDPFHEFSGVGFKMIGVPTDYDKFIDILEDQSCQPIIARQILDDLIANGHRSTTLVRFLPFDKIEVALSRLGVSCIMIKPFDVNESGQREKLDAAHQARELLLSGTEISDDEKNDFTDTYISLGREMFKRYGSVINKKYL